MMRKIFLALILSSSTSVAGGLADLGKNKPVDLNSVPAKYRYQKEYKYELSKRVLIKGRIDASGKKIQMEYSDEKEMQEMMRLKEWQDDDMLHFMETQELALAGLSTGGLLYMFPNNKVFFWDADEDSAREMSRGKRIWTSPILGNILSSALSRFQKALKNDQGEVVESKGLRSFLMVLVDPAYSFVEKINQLANRKVFYSGRTELITMTPDEMQTLGYQTQSMANYVGFRFTLRF